MQYFDKIVNLRDDEVFIDCGAYIGDTVDSFVNRVPNYKRIVCFEPDEQNFKILEKKRLHDFYPIKAGVWIENTSLSFRDDIANGSFVSENSDDMTTRVKVVSIDSIQECAEATFIKMDIEGSELPALKGATKTILKNHPKLAICIYHSNEDMMQIAEYIHSLQIDYNYYVRHYSYEAYDTVLYAIPKGEIN